MQPIHFDFVYPVTRTVLKDTNNVVYIEPVALLRIKGYGTVNLEDRETNKNSCLSFRITDILLEEENIVAFLPAIDNSEAITQACIDQLWEAAQKKYFHHRINHARVFQLPIHSRAK